MKEAVATARSSVRFLQLESSSLTIPATGAVVRELPRLCLTVGQAARACMTTIRTARQGLGVEQSCDCHYLSYF